MPDPAGQSIEAVSPIRDNIEERVRRLLADVNVTPPAEGHSTSCTPTLTVLFLCVKNGGKSQMVAGLMRQISGDSVHVYSAGTKRGDGINALSAESLAEVGVNISDRRLSPSTLSYFVTSTS